MNNFEYKVLNVKPKSAWSFKIEEEIIEKELNDLGKEGWELVSVQPNMQSGTSISITLFLKRVSRF